MPNSLDLFPDYKLLNSAVNEVFFDGRFDHRPIYLDLEGHIQTELADKVGFDRTGDLDAYIGIVVADTLTEDQQNIYSWHESCLLEWDHTSPPPFTLLLLSFSLAAEHMHDDSELSLTNYYGRLAELYGKRELYEALSHARKYYGLFWSELNRWLTNNDYGFGIPTAKQFGHLKYVGLALSQALIREADRESFIKLFSKYDLSSTDNLGENELEPYVAHWMESSDPSNHLKNIWRNQNLKEKLVSSALQELESWSGVENTANDSGLISKRLFWVIRIKSFPKRKALMYLCSNDQAQEAVSLSVLQNKAENDFENADNKLSLIDLPGADGSYLAPQSAIDRAQALLTPFKVSDESGAIYKNSPRLIIPFNLVGAGHYYRETLQILLHEKYGILCHENWQKKVKGYIETHGRDDFLILEGPESGLPAGWCFFQNVEIVAAPVEDVDDDLHDLVPLNKGTSIQISGGLNLSQNVWHAELPPNIFATNNGSGLTIKVFDSGSNQNEPVLIEERSEKHPDFLRSSNLDLSNKSLTFSVCKNNSYIIEKTLSFRSANTPRVYPAEKEKYLFFDFDFPENFWSARTTDSNTKALYPLSGFSWIDDEPPIESSIPVKTFQALPFSGSSDSDNEYLIVESDYGDDLNAPQKNPCIARGLHVWLVPEGVSKKTSKEAILSCADCGARVLWKRKRVSTQTPDRSIEPGTVKKVVVDPPDNPVNGNQIFDAMCYKGFGSWSLLQKLLGHLVDEPWKVRIKAEQFSDLGLLDIEKNPVTGQPLAWSIPPPTLIKTGESSFFLAGFRCQTMVEAIREAFETKGATYHNEPIEGNPSYIGFSGLVAPINEIELTLAQIPTPKNQSISLSTNFGEKLVSVLPSLTEMLDFFPDASFPSMELERFDPFSGKWKKSESELLAGTYRFNGPPRKYFTMSENGSIKATNYETGKIYAARLAKLQIQDYDVSTEKFKFILGCDLPLLYRRALVGCSGKLPVFAENNVVEYLEVPDSVGIPILNKLYGEDIK